jgi:hypothetical protein
LVFPTVKLQYSKKTHTKGMRDGGRLFPGRSRVFGIRRGIFDSRRVSDGILTRGFGGHTARELSSVAGTERFAAGNAKVLPSSGCPEEQILDAGQIPDRKMIGGAGRTTHTVRLKGLERRVHTVSG